MALQGPSGGIGGSEFRDNPPASQIRQIIVHHGAYINKIEVHYDDGTVLTHGNKSAPYVDLFALNAGDYLTGIDGRTGNLEGDGGPYVCSIRFTSKSGMQSPEWGGEAPSPGGFPFPSTSNFQRLTPYFYVAPPGQSILGFWGRSGDYIDQIGIITP